MKQSLKILTVIVAALSLSGCDSVRHTLGLDHYQPDEFNIVDHPPLSMPKDYNLRPPSDGNTPIKEVDRSTNQAAQTLLGGNLGVGTGGSSNKNLNTVVDRAKSAQTIDPNIRETLDKEAKEEGGVLGEKLKEIKDNAASIYK